jgi:carboxypeptidase C (cathepsin A)
VTIYNGQLDLICCTLGVYQWLTRLQWDGLADFKKAKPVAVHVDDEDDDDDDDDDADNGNDEVDDHDEYEDKDDGAKVDDDDRRRRDARRSNRILDVDTVGFIKAHANLALFTILDAGHMVPADQPEAGLYLLSQVIFHCALSKSKMRGL